MKHPSYTLLSLFLVVGIGRSDLLAQCNLSTATGCQCRTAGQTNCDLLPDITVSWYALQNYAGGPNEYSQTDETNPGRLRVTGSTPNIGAGPLNVRGVDRNGYRWFLCGTDTISIYDPSSSQQFSCSNGQEAKQLILQRVYHKNGSSMTFTEHIAGTMTYHPTHGHNHVDDWAIFTLRVQVPGEPDPRNWPIVGEGAKVGFCLMDYYPCTSGSANGHCRTSQEYGGGTVLNQSGHFMNYGLGGGSYNCSTISQGISAGYTDVYSESLDGMWINIPPGTCNGSYWIVMEVDPNNNFIEENDDNNWTAIPFTLTKQQPAGSASIIASAPLTQCAGTPVQLTASPGVSYEWSNGATTQSIIPDVSGSYSCTVTGPCGVSTTEPVAVTLLDAPEPTGTGGMIGGDGHATLHATGTDVRWYDAPVGGNQVGAGNTFVTPALTGTTSYWAEDRLTHQPAPVHVGKLSNSGGGGYSSADQYLLFDAYAPFTLKSVRVYAQGAGNRTFQVLNSSGSVLAQTTVNVPNGDSRVTLNLNVPQGNNLRLYVTSTLRNLYRNTGGVSYPYTAGNVVSINNSSAGADYYYYAYDWEVSMPEISCTSERVEVVAAQFEGYAVHAKVFLEGPYVEGTGIMHDALRSAGVIPATEPFTQAGFQHAGGGGGETIAPGVLEVTGPNAIVDWVLVELRSALDPTQIVATRSALLRRSGVIVAANGGELRFPVTAGQYFVAVRHRNHLGCMTGQPVTLGAATAVVDLTDPATPAWGVEARKQQGGAMMLWSGNAHRDNKVMYTGASNDRDPILSRVGGVVPTASVTGYHNEDVNLDGEVRYTGAFNDRDPILINIGGVVPTQTRTEQLP